jgi:glycosyltransferase involved in cell wall biosynthesis
MVRELGLEDFVAIGPPLYGQDKWDALRACGLFVFPSRWDAASVMLLEAAGAGAPLVVSRTTPLGRYLGTLDAALLVDTTASSIASGIVRALSTEAEHLSARALQVARERFSWPAVAESYARQLADVLSWA